MALIKCPDCGGQVSDKAPACIHCGYPITSENSNYQYSCLIDGEVIDLTYLEKAVNELSLEDKDDLYNQCKWSFETWVRPGVDKPIFNSNDNIQVALNAGNITNAINKFLGWNVQNKKAVLSYKLLTLCIENDFNTNDYISNESLTPKIQPSHPQPFQQNQLTCPRCGSTSITTEEQGYGLFGWIGASQKKNLCQKCGYKWCPGR